MTRIANNIQNRLFGFPKRSYRNTYWIYRAAYLGDAEAMEKLGDYYAGLKTTIMLGHAAHWYEKAEAAGRVSAKDKAACAIAKTIGGTVGHFFGALFSLGISVGASAIIEGTVAGLAQKDLAGKPGATEYKDEDKW